MCSAAVVADSLRPPWTAGHMAPAHQISQASYRCWVPPPPPGDLPDPGIAPVSPASPALAGGLFTTEPPGKALQLVKKRTNNTMCITCHTGEEKSETVYNS